MASLQNIFRILSVLIIAICLSHCQSKESAGSGSGSGSGGGGGGSGTPSSGNIEGRILFGSGYDLERYKSKISPNKYSNRIIVKYKDIDKKQTPDKILKKARSAAKNPEKIATIGEFDLEDDAKNKKNVGRMSILKKKKDPNKSKEENVLTQEEQEELVKTLNEDENVEYAFREQIKHWWAFNDKYNYKQWGLTKNFINFEDEKWADLIKGTEDEIRVAVIDTGYRPHKDLEGKILTDVGYDFISDTYFAADGDEIDSDPTDMGDVPEGTTSFYHGTFVAGIIAAKRDQEGITGIAHNSKIIHIRVLGTEGSGTDFDIAQGIKYAAGLPNVSGKVLSKEKGKRDSRADVINLSLGGPGESPIIHEALKEAVAEGIPVVCAAGNEGEEIPNDYHLPSFPASYSECISVGALGPSETDSDYVRAWYSNYLMNVDIMAPGGGSSSSNVYADDVYKESPSGEIPYGVYSTHWIPFIDQKECYKAGANFPQCSGYEASYGTSFAAPHVTGIVALMKTVNPSLNANGISSILFRTAKPSNGDINNRKEFGYGVLDALKAVSTAKTVASIGEKVIVKLLNPADFSEVVSVGITAESDFTFSIENVTPGDYVLHAGTDMDENGIICEKGEKFGYYPKKGAAVFKLTSGMNLKDLEITLEPVKSALEVCEKYKKE